MDRRNFIKNILVAGASFTILPGASRIWTPRRIGWEDYGPLEDVIKTHMEQTIVIMDEFMLKCSDIAVNHNDLLGKGWEW